MLIAAAAFSVRRLISSALKLLNFWEVIRCAELEIDLLLENRSDDRYCGERTKEEGEREPHQRFPRHTYHLTTNKQVCGKRRFDRLTAFRALDILCFP